MSVETAGNASVIIVPLTHQVAGHYFGKGRTKLRILQTSDGFILKPLQLPPKGEREHNFYKRIFSGNSDLNQDENDLKCLLPTYRGYFTHNEVTYIKMDDLAYGIRYPSVIDIKIGMQTFDPEATSEQINRHKMKYPFVKNIGFQIEGMRILNNLDCSFSHYDKAFGRSLNEEELIHGLGLYFQFHQTPQIIALKETIRKCEEIKEWFERQATYHFFSSSLIVVYESFLQDILDQNLNESFKNSLCYLTSNNSESKSKLKTNLVRVIMADFAHVFPAKFKRDENYLNGITKLLEYLNYLLRVDYVFKDIRTIQHLN